MREGGVDKVFVTYLYVPKIQRLLMKVLYTTGGEYGGEGGRQEREG